MDDKTLVETFLPISGMTFWDTDKGVEEFYYSSAYEELYESEIEGSPIAFPRTLKAARQILKEAGWTIIPSRTVEVEYLSAVGHGEARAITPEEHEAFKLA